MRMALARMSRRHCLGWRTNHLVQSYLEQAGYAVLTAYDGATALRTIRTERPDLVVLDLMLPDQDGWSITRTVRADATSWRHAQLGQAPGN